MEVVFVSLFFLTRLNKRLEVLLVCLVGDDAGDAPSRVKVTLCPPPSLPGLSAQSLVVGGLCAPLLPYLPVLNVKTTPNNTEETSVGDFSQEFSKRKNRDLPREMILM